ncbi:hypothetical protein E2320_014538 [Naja naja]|nr:hypothetical protein E2320_014538 [Naja naja]
MPHHRGCLRLLAAFCLTVLFLTFTASYKPVIVVHGLFDSPSDFQLLLNFINETHPGTNVSVVDLFDRTESLKSLWMQVEGFRQAIYPIMQNAVDGVHLYCYSQDPHHRDLYLNNSNFLAVLNDERFHPNASGRAGKSIFGLEHPLYLGPAWKKNLLRIRKLILIGGPDDGVIMPWESSGKLMVEWGFPMTLPRTATWELEAEWEFPHDVAVALRFMVYLLDTFGLKTLDARGDIVFCKMANVSHTTWHSNRTVYDTCVAKWLT